MEWRCAWCGKPHDSDDPPCDNCGHNTFEKAVERVAANSQAQGAVWVCPDCGRQHQKHSPPCSRCGNLELEQRDVSELDDPLDDIGTRWRDVVEPKYVVGYVAVGALLIVLVLGFLGIIPLPGFGEPAIPDAPGQADTARTISLDAVERETVIALNERRQGASVVALGTGDTLGAMAAYYNKAVVAARYGDGDGPDSDALNRFEPDCETRPVLLQDASVAENGDALFAQASGPDAVAAALVSTLEGNPRFDDLLDADQDAVGVDVHIAPDGRVFVTVVAC